MTSPDNHEEVGSRPTDRRALLAGIGGLAAGTFLTAGRAEAGPLEPPGAPASTPGPEPRIAINAQNTPGDGNSVYKITQPGSYYLTGNVIGQSGSHGIKIMSSNVSIELMGFELRGIAGSLDGITVEGTCDNLVVQNGIASGWGRDGVRLIEGGTVPLGTGALVEGVMASGNGERGILTSQNSVVRRCTVSSNLGHGIWAYFGSTIVECAARANGIGTLSSAGIYANAGCSVTNCAAVGNGGNGIMTLSGCSVVGCSAYLNGADGIATSSGGTVSSCSAVNNGNSGISAPSGCTVAHCSATFNGLAGIECGGDCLIKDNTCDSNSGAAGILVTSGDNRIDGNHCTDNGRGIEVQAAGNFVVRNTCALNSTNFQFVADNRYGTIVDIIATGTAAVNGSSADGTLTTTNPWANFAY
jgi:parallel beta-helix repeat protein